MGKVSDTLSPDVLVELGVNSHVGGFHHLGDELLDALDGLGSLVLEGGAVSEFVDIDGGVDGGFVETSSLFFLDHNSILLYYLIN